MLLSVVTTVLSKSHGHCYEKNPRLYIYIYICIEREIYIYIGREREREKRGREGERERPALGERGSAPKRGSARYDMFSSVGNEYVDKFSIIIYIYICRERERLLISQGSLSRGYFFNCVFTPPISLRRQLLGPAELFGFPAWEINVYIT